MTSSLHRSVRNRAFTLLEMLVVITIIAALAAIAVPMISRAHKAALHNAMAADLAVIASALDAYKSDFGDYPRRTVTDVNGNHLTGAALLCWALIAPGPVNQDGADGFGFRIRGTTGTVKGPYLPTDRFTIGIYLNAVTKSPNMPGISDWSNLNSVVTTPPAQAGTDDTCEMLADRNDRPILYFPANKGADGYATTVPGGAYVGTTDQAVFDYADNNPAAGSVLAIDQLPNILTKKIMSFRLGAPGKTQGSPPDGNLYAAQVPAATGPYLLWSSGTDTLFGTGDDIANNGSDLQLNTSNPTFSP
jgi:prepilin-type N-terminal cleavage/methylation domain-containing protein